MEASNHHGHTEENTKSFVNMHHLKSLFQDFFFAFSTPNILNGFFIISYRGAEDFLSVKRMAHNLFYTAITLVATI